MINWVVLLVERENSAANEGAFVCVWVHVGVSE